MIYVFLTFYAVLYVYGLVFVLAGIRSLIWLTDGDGLIATRKFAIQFATVSLSVVIFASLILDELILNGIVEDVAATSPHYLKAFSFCAFQFLNSFCFDAFASFGLEPDFGVTLIPSLGWGSLLVYSLNVFGGVAALNLILLAVRLHSRQANVGRF